MIFKKVFAPLVLLGMIGMMIPCAAAADHQEDDVVGRMIASDAAFSREDAAVQDVMLGSLTADALRLATGADVALVPCGDFSDAEIGVRNLTYGELCELYVSDQEIMTAEMSVTQLCERLEYGFSAVTLDDVTKQIDRDASYSDAFLQLSGLEVVYDCAAPAGERLYRLERDGEEVDPSDDSIVFTVAAGADFFSGAYGFPEQEAEGTGITYTEAMLSYLAENDVIEEYESGRVKPIGQSGDSILANFPALAIAIVVVMFILGNIVVLRQRKERTFEEKENRYFRPKDPMIG